MKTYLCLLSFFVVLLLSDVCAILGSEVVSVYVDVPLHAYFSMCVEEMLDWCAGFRIIVLYYQHSPRVRREWLREARPLSLFVQEAAAEDRLICCASLLPWDMVNAFVRLSMGTHSRTVTPLT